jgi:hypothetical protein
VRGYGFVGIPALSPRIASFSSGVPIFTEQDVADYLNTNPPRWGRRYHWIEPATVATIEFLDAQQVSERLQLPPQTFAAALLCLVTLRGEFTFVGMRGMAPLTMTRCWLVFDAHSGNLLHQQIDHAS